MNSPSHLIASAAVLSFAVSIISVQGCMSPPPCRDQASVEALSEAYILSVVLLESQTVLATMPDSLSVYVPRHAALFRANGESIRCARALSLALLRQVVNLYDRKAYDDAMEVATRYGLPEFAAPIASSMSAPLAGVLDIAIELKWLSEVLPAMADGNTDPYYATGSPNRLLRRSGLPTFELGLEMVPPEVREAMIMEQVRPLEVDKKLILAFAAALPGKQ
jgi:hypothetical protein